MKKSKTSNLYKQGNSSKSQGLSMLAEKGGQTPGEMTRQQRRKSTLAKAYQDRGGKFFKEDDGSKTEDELGFEAETADLLGDLSGVGEKDPEKRKIIEKRKALQYINDQDLKDKNFQRSNKRTELQKKAIEDLMDAEEMSDLSDEADLEKELGLDVGTYRKSLSEDQDTESEEYIDKLLEGYDAKGREDSRNSDIQRILRKKRAR